MQSNRTDLTEWILRAAIVVLLVALVGVVADTLRDKTIGVGDRAPDFQIQTESGLTVSRSDFGGKVLVLNFWATWCPPCIEEMPSLDQLHAQFKEDGVVVLGVSVDEDQAAYRSFLERSKVSFLVANDPQASISDRFGTYRYPETYVIDARGMVVQKIIGKADWTDARMVNYIRSLL